jgi:hypothetical protein
MSTYLLLRYLLDESDQSDDGGEGCLIGILLLIVIGILFIVGGASMPDYSLHIKVGTASYHCNSYGYGDDGSLLLHDCGGEDGTVVILHPSNVRVIEQ